MLIHCRLSTTCLLALLCIQCPNYYLVWLGLIQLDIFSHWMQMYSSLAAGDISHKVQSLFFLLHWMSWHQKLESVFSWLAFSCESPLNSVEERKSACSNCATRLSPWSLRFIVFNRFDLLKLFNIVGQSWMQVYKFARFKLIMHWTIKDHRECPACEQWKPLDQKLLKHRAGETGVWCIHFVPTFILISLICISNFLHTLHFKQWHWTGVQSGFHQLKYDTCAAIK